MFLSDSFWSKADRDSRRDDIYAYKPGRLGTVATLLRLIGIVTIFFAASGCQSSAADIADIVRETEHRRVRALVDADMEVADLLHANDFRLINPAGIERTKEEYLRNVETGQADYLSWEPETIDIRVFGDSAVLRYKSNLHIVLGGEDQGIRPHWHIDYYELRDGTWKVVWSQATAVAE